MWGAFKKTSLNNVLMIIRHMSIFYVLFIIYLFTHSHVFYSFPQRLRLKRESVTVKMTNNVFAVKVSTWKGMSVWWRALQEVRKRCSCFTGDVKCWNLRECEVEIGVRVKFKDKQNGKLWNDPQCVGVFFLKNLQVKVNKSTWCSSYLPLTYLQFWNHHPWSN